MARTISYSILKAFNSVAADGSGAEQYFTQSNASDLAGFVSPEELQYRIDEGYVSVVENYPAAAKTFVDPRKEVVAPAAVAAPKAGLRSITSTPVKES